MANQYNITNKQNGLKFSYVADEPQEENPPEWGTDPEIVVTDITAQVNAEKEKEVKKKEAKEKLKLAEVKPDDGVPQLRELMKDILTILKD